MHLSAVWVAPIVSAGVGAAALATVAAAVRKEVAALQRTLRPLRVRTGRSLPPGRGNTNPGPGRTR